MNALRKNLATALIAASLTVTASAAQAGDPPRQPNTQPAPQPPVQEYPFTQEPFSLLPFLLPMLDVWGRFQDNAPQAPVPPETPGGSPSDWAPAPEFIVIL